MKLTVEERPDAAETEVRITCRAVDRRVQAVIAAVSALDQRLTGIAEDGSLVIVDAASVLYAESVDGACFLYGAQAVVESPLRLIELEARLADTDFVRASRALLVNFDHVRALRPRPGARLELVLDNGESVIASRQFAPAIKEKIGL